ncbi:MAG TPA: hypothetical protein RMH99_17015, partial [Sandaracinaceae bacterium LLY-WYZ-13_1]|nr:hypothetical protein [Sandaracinaceae bacterium LLY-WYZ-13_1]
MGAPSSEIAPRPLVVVVSTAGAPFRASVDTVLEHGGRVLRVEPEDAEAAIPQLEPEGVVLCTGPELAGRLAAATDAPLIALEGRSEEGLSPSSCEALGAFTRALRTRTPDGRVRLRDTGRELGHPDATFDGLRVLVVGTGPARVDRLTHELRARGAVVAVAEPDGSGLAAGHAIDPQIALVAGSSDTIHLRLRRDPVLRWAFPLHFEWHALTDADGSITLSPLCARIAPLLEVERSLWRQAMGRDRVDTTLDLLGPGRLLRVLGEVDRPLRVAVRSLSARGELDLAPGLVLGARWWQDESRRPRFRGTGALAAFLCQDEAWVRVERVERPRHGGVVLAVEEALEEARRMLEPVAEELPTAPHVPPWPARPSSRPPAGSEPPGPWLPPPAPLPEELPRWDDVAAEPSHSGVQRRRRPAQPAGSLPPPQGDEPTHPSPTAAPPDGRPPRRRSRWPLALGAVGLLGALALGAGWWLTAWVLRAGDHASAGSIRLPDDGRAPAVAPSGAGSRAGRASGSEGPSALEEPEVGARERAGAGARNA